MLVRDLAEGAHKTEKLRTEVGAGYLTNSTVDVITDKGTWKIAQVIGPFRTKRQAEVFASVWTTSGDAKHAHKATRGPIVRSSRGEVLAGLLGLSCWIDYAVVWNCSQIHWSIDIVSSEVVLKRKVPASAA